MKLTQHWIFDAIAATLGMSLGMVVDYGLWNRPQGLEVCSSFGGYGLPVIADQHRFAFAGMLIGLCLPIVRELLCPNHPRRSVLVTLAFASRNCALHFAVMACGMFVADEVLKRAFVNGPGLSGLFQSAVMIASMFAASAGIGALAVWSKVVGGDLSVSDSDGTSTAHRPG
ncbi:hypothetical protein ELH51_36390 (plasmid) [Rhizobium ruizarguesonis]|uniref:hypothetical protein n=1 Tax=Rhizobium ruizarguesonis TaxID=2081791 RepID=UPI001030EB87|nr:hypothetical protein [Rhizobium ruizarguesonis]TBB15614.1 hypothetical protein ELH51_36390 [Rhizobium ruizarguesonis]